MRRTTPTSSERRCVSTTSGTMSADGASVLVAIQDGLATLTLNKPQRLNGLDSAMAAQLR